MGTNAVNRGPVGGRLASNMRRLRDEQHLSLEALSGKLEQIGRPMLKSGLGKLENGDRRADVDDLVALAVALGVNPSALLLPTESDDEPVELTSTVTAPAFAAWQWVDGLMPLPTRAADDADDPYNTLEEVEEFHRLARPPALRRTEQHPAMRAAVQLTVRIRRVVYHATKPTSERNGSDLGLETTVSFARRAVERVTSELDEVEEQHRGER